MVKKDKRIDDYIQAAPDFAQPILTHLRALIHQNCPDIEETIKWRYPTFEYAGAIICNLAAFKKHCRFGFWRGDEFEDKHNLLEPVGNTAMAHLSNISTLDSLPSDEILAAYIKMALKGSSSSKKKVAKPQKEVSKKLEIPVELETALKTNKAANATFQNFSYSNKKEYVEWLHSAKTEKTKHSRLATTLEWLAEGKTRHWKYLKK